MEYCLVHHGIKGQKWGVRRWQNKDGSLTPQGYPHYGIGVPRASKDEVGSGHIKAKHRENLRLINKNETSRAGRARALLKEEIAYKKALKNQEKTDQINSMHKNTKRSIESIKNEGLKKVLLDAENKKYEREIGNQERLNQGKMTVNKALKIGAGLVMVGALGYALYDSYASPSTSKGQSYGKSMTKLMDSLSSTDRDRFAAAKSWVYQPTAYSYHAAKNFSERFWNHNLSDSERKGVREYTGNAYSAMNKFLRTGSMEGTWDYYGKSTEKTLQLIDGCTKALEKSRIKEDVIVHRGIGGSLTKMLGVTPAQLNQMSSSDLIGTVFTDKGFVSTGVTESDAWGGVKMHALIPAGSKGMYVDPVSKHKGEHELLLQRNSSFVIKSVVKNDDGKITDILVELVDQTID